jgi:hypothetical protein
MKNAQFTTYDVRKCCERENKLDIDFNTTGKEYNGWFKKNDRKIRRITVPRGRKPIGKGLYRSMARQLYLTTAQFDDLLECPLDKGGYEEILKNIGVLNET